MLFFTEWVPVKESNNLEQKNVVNDQIQIVLDANLHIAIHSVKRNKWRATVRQKIRDQDPY